MNKQEELDALLEDITEAELADMMNKKGIHRKLFNQPALISVSSVNAVNQGQETGSFFNEFTVNLQRPALDVESIQLLQTNIPQCNANIPDTACVFWYYRLSLYKGSIPTVDNLYYTRLLPSFYKPEFINSSSTYGFNETFASYKNLATQLALSTTNDLAVNNYNIYSAQNDLNIRIPFIPNDISLTYNSGINKFQMIGNNNTVAYVAWDAGTTYGLGDIVYYTPATYSPSLLYVQNSVVVYGGQTWVVIVASVLNDAPNYTSGNWGWYSNNSLPLAFQSLIVGNRGNAPIIVPALSIPAWKQINIDVIMPYSSSTAYSSGQYVSYLGSIYQVPLDDDGASEVLYNVVPTTWTHIDPTKVVWYNYLSTGYNDPNVALLQGDYFNIKWNQNTLYEVGQTIEYTPTGSLWNAAVSYPQCSYVYYGNTTYLALAPSTNINPSSSVALWNSSSIYPAGSTVKVGSSLYQSTLITFNLNPTVTIPTWNLGTYPQYSIVRYSGTSYQANRITNLNPTATNSGWTVISQTSIVQIWIPLSITSIWLPVSTSYFTAITQNLGSIPIDMGTAWSSSTTYNVGDITNYQGFVYFCRSAGSNHAPVGSTNTYWTLFSLAGWSINPHPIIPTTGLYGITKQFDYIESVYNNGFARIQTITNFPIGAGQPFNPKPARLLNSILGFTWDGSFVSADFSILMKIQLYNGVFYTGTTTFAKTLTRLRPIPLAIVVSGVGLGSSLTASTYTAEGYCNLVYSSIISIYTNIIGSATLDTQRNSNLLAITSMNCGNLGVAFWSNYVDNPLLQVNDDIYSIRIEFRDEFGEPYMLSNNAVATLSFKIKYKKYPDIV